MSNYSTLPSSFVRNFLTCSTLSVVALMLGACGSPDQKAQQYYENGMALIAKNDDVEARRELLKAAKYKSDKVEIWRALAGVDERTKANVNAIFNDLRRVVELDPKDLDARVKLASIMVSGGAAESALKILDAATENDKPNARLHSVRALALARTNDVQGALREAQRAYEIDPANVDAVGILAGKKLAEGDSSQALKMLEALPPSLSPTDEARISQLKLDALLRKGDLNAAEALARKLANDNPKDGNRRLQLVQILTAERKYDEAVKELRERERTNPADTKLGLDVVRFLNTYKGADAARAELEARIKAEGNTVDYKLALAELDFYSRRQANAVAALQKLATETQQTDQKLMVQSKLAEMLVANGDKLAAEPLIADILSKDRRNASALRLRAALSLDKGQTDSAIADLREALNDQPKSPELLIALALAYEQGGKPELADRQYADALKNSNLNPEVALRYVGFLQRRNDPARADDVLTEVVGRNPGNLQLLTSLAQIKLSRQNWPAAMAIAQTMAQIKDGKVTSDQIRAAALAGQDRFAESIVALQDAHKSAPEAIQPAVALASAYIRAERADEAVTLIQDMTKRYPGNAELLVVLGQTKLAQKKDNDAIASFKDAIAKQPKDPAGYAALSDYYVRVKNYDAADEVLRGALKEIPQNVTLRMSMASLQIMKNNNAAAIEQYESILKDFPQAQPAIAINNLASLLLDTKTDKASIDRAAALADNLKSVNQPQFQDTVGWARFKQGDIKSAITILQDAATKAPNTAPLRYHLGLAYAASGQALKAREELEAAAKLEPDGTSLKQSIQDALKQN